ncbi:MAG: hypothetical protein ACXVDJ_08730 [Tumebacillaceae bacterium]
MFEKPFELLNRAVDRIEVQLATADVEQKRILGEELMALRGACDKFVEKWLSFEERVTELSEEFHLDLDGNMPAGELQQMQENRRNVHVALLRAGGSRPAYSPGQTPERGLTTRARERILCFE